MKKLGIAALVASGIALGAFGQAHTAAAADDFTFSFNTGDVAFAYNDGYWDHDHHWHRWHNAREAREYRTRYADHYHAWKHTRDHDRGWHDDDHDGVPNRLDNHPENPNRQ